MKNDIEYYQKKIASKSRVRQQTKKKVSQTSGTLSQQIKRGELASKRKKKSVEVRIRDTKLRIATDTTKI